MAFGKTARLVIAGLYVLAMLFVAVMPAPALGPSSFSTVASDATCGPDMGSMTHAAHGVKNTDGACDLSDHQGSAPCMIGSICADLPTGVFAALLPASVVPERLTLAVGPTELLLGRAPDPSLRPPSSSV
jgi:hypothetical protein